MDGKAAFLNTARLLPRPVSKSYPKDEIQVEYRTSSLRAYSRIERTEICRLVKPAQEAVYECEPLLSEAEEAQIGGAA